LLSLDYAPNISFILIYFFKGIKTIIDSLSSGFNIFMLLDDKVNGEDLLNKSNNSKELKNLHIHYMDREKLDQFQQTPIVGQANPDNR